MHFLGAGRTMTDRIETLFSEVETLGMQGKWGLISGIANGRGLSILFSGGQTLIFLGVFNEEVVLF